MLASDVSGATRTISSLPGRFSKHLLEGGGLLNEDISDWLLFTIFFFPPLSGSMVLFCHEIRQTGRRCKCVVGICHQTLSVCMHFAFSFCQYLISYASVESGINIRYVVRIKKQKSLKH